MPAMAALPELRLVSPRLGIVAYWKRTDVTAIQVSDEESNNHHRRKPTVEFPEKFRFSRRIYHQVRARVTRAGRVEIAILGFNRHLFHGHYRHLLSNSSIELSKITRLVETYRHHSRFPRSCITDIFYPRCISKLR